MSSEMLRNIENVRKGQLSVESIARERLAVFERENPKVNAVVEVHPEGLIRQAREIDKRVSAGQAGRLAGAVVTVKDNLYVKGMKATAGLTKLKDSISDEDSEPVRRLRAEDALIFGKTNMPSSAMDTQTDNPVYGRTNHPLFTDRTCGGSSGGGACAVRLGIGDLDIGNDFLGSIRIPAHFCGVFGFVPTECAIRAGDIAGGSLLGSTVSRILRIGVQSSDPANIAYVLPFLFDRGYPVMAPVGDRSNTLRIAWSDSCGGIPLSKDSRQCFAAFRERLAAGHDLHELGDAEFDFNAARTGFLKIMYGSVAATLSPALCFVLRRMMGQKYMSGSLKEYLQAEDIREDLMLRLDELFESCDCLIVPTTATPAFVHQKPDRMQGSQPIYDSFSVDGKKVSYAAANLGFTTPFYTCNPIIDMPIGTTEDGLPIGIQVVGRRYHEYDLFKIVERLSSASEAYITV